MTEQGDDFSLITRKRHEWKGVDTSKHSATPWRACKEGECSCGMVWSLPGDFPVFTAAGEHMSHHIGDAHTLMADAPDMVYAAVSEDVAKANAAFIVKAVNCHDDLVSTLNMVREWVSEALHSRDPDVAEMAAADIRSIDAALAKAQQP